MSIFRSNEALVRALGVIIMPCAAIMTIPPTSIVGAILWTGYLGDVLATHLRIL
jgi:Na+/H+ antiporter NhaC